jgi:hypothetical protein
MNGEMPRPPLKAVLFLLLTGLAVVLALPATTDSVFVDLFTAESRGNYHIQGNRSEGES